MTSDANHIVAGAKPWNRWVFDEIIAGYPGTWHFVSQPDGLSPEKVSSLAPRYTFFLHWYWKVPSEIVNNYECVCFHVTDVPYG